VVAPAEPNNAGERERVASPNPHFCGRISRRLIRINLLAPETIFAQRVASKCVTASAGVYRVGEQVAKPIACTLKNHFANCRVAEQIDLT